MAAKPKPRMPRTQLLAIVAAAAFAVAGTATGLYLIESSNDDLIAQRTAGMASIGGPFSLTDEDGKRVTEADLLGKPTAMFFGFTFCPDVCPMTLFELTNYIEKLGPDADKLNYVFVSVDWERDGPEEMAQYTSAFDERIRGFSGTEAEIAAITKAYRVFYRRVPTEDGDYTIDHTASVYLMDGDGQLVSTIAYDENPEAALAKLQRLADAA
ncbi:SCO family protein [Bauldia sp.]|uniref:SCO family protein n=1 Tax=Bauldia sp. TaxID=2575872 RepID=UPI003BA99D77